MKDCCAPVESSTPDDGSPSARDEHAARQRRFTIGACVLLLVSAFYLWTEHRAHLLGALPYLLLLACPLMHLFMHRKHRGSSSSAHQH